MKWSRKPSNRELDQKAAKEALQDSRYRLYKVKQRHNDIKLVKKFLADSK